MTYRGTVSDGVIVLQDGLQLPEGTPVSVEPLEAALLAAPTEASLKEFDSLIDEFADTFDACSPTPRPVLSDAALTREGIYQGHP